MKFLLVACGLALLALAVVAQSTWADQWLASHPAVISSSPIAIAAREPNLTQEPRAVLALTHRRVVFEWLKASGVVPNA